MYRRTKIFNFNSSKEMIKIFQLMGFSLIKYLIAGFVIALVLAIHPGNAQASSLDIYIKDCIKPLPPGYTERLFSGLGNHKYPIMMQGSNVPDAQDYLNQGMTLLYAFNHPEAIHSFNQAAKDDPKAAMPYWGIAMAAGPDINTGATDACLKLAYKAVKLAKNEAKTELERRIANALTERYKHTKKQPAPVNAKDEMNNAKSNLGVCVDAQGKKVKVDELGNYVCVDAIAYADAMKTLKEEYKDDLKNRPDVLTLYAAAQMNISPWQWWTNGKPSKEIREALQVLSGLLDYDPNNNNEVLKKLLKYDPKKNKEFECKPTKDEVIKDKPNYIGANHYFIHATEESPCPEVALPSANRISELAPAAGHIQHMPSHVYQRTGEYTKATEANYKALYVDRAYIRQTPETARYPLHYLSHNLHFLTDSLSIQGRKSEALAAAQQLFENTKKYSWDGYNPLHNQTLVQAKDDYFFTVPIWTAIRFNAWDFLSKIRCEEALFEFFTQRNLPFTKAMQSYGQVLKYLATTPPVTIESALAKLEKFWKKVGQADPKLELQYGNNDASQLFRIANLVLVARTLEALLPKESVGVINDFIEKVKNQLENSRVFSKDASLFGKVTSADDIKKQIIKIWERAVCVENGKKAVCEEEGLNYNVCEEKGLNYNEPPDWYYPVRESLGAAYYRQGKYDKAAKVFCKDLEIANCEDLKNNKMNDDENLKIHKMNGRSLFGLIMSLENQKKKSATESEPLPIQRVPETEFCVNPDKDKVIKKLCEEFKEAWKNAPVKPSLKTM